MEAASPPPGGSKIYQRLNVELRQIRLLTIQPGEFNDELQCFLNVASLSDTCSYETISYTWGDVRHRSSFVVNGDIINVPFNSMAALRRMRLSDRQRVVWIDSICINQRDDLEKSTQVALMSEIYSNGNHNLVYLGDDREGCSQMTLHWMRYVKLQVRQAVKDPGELMGKLLRGDLEIPRTHDLDLYLLQQLYGLPWFRRLWVLQEAALSKDSTCYWGSTKMSLNQVLLVARVSDASNELHPLGLRNANAMFTECLTQYLGISDRSYYRIAMACDEFSATDPRDYVFAPLALYLVHQPPHHTTSPLLVPDYTKTAQEVFRDATRYTLEGHRVEASLILLHIQHLSQRDLDSSITSWTRQFGRRGDPHQGWLPPPLDLSDYGAGFKDKSDAAKLTIVTSRRPGADPNIITLFIAVLGSVLETTIESSPEALDHDTGSLKVVVRTAHAMAQFQHDVTALVLAVGRLDVPNGFLFTDSAHLLEGYHIFLANLNSDPELMPALSEESILGERYRRLFALAAVNRRFFKTATGLVGCGPGVMKEGDVVVIPENASHPCVLRPVGEQYLFLGMAYVYGIMHGEVFDMDVEWKWVDIR